MIPSDSSYSTYTKLLSEEYRFEVRLGWDRANYFLVLNSAILAVATGLLKADNPPFVYVFVSLLFFFGATTSIAGALSIAKAHEYYRKTIVKKTAIEERLGLNNALPEMHESFNLAIGTTRGQNDRMLILNDPEKWMARPQRKNSITFLITVILWMMAGSQWDRYWGGLLLHASEVDLYNYDFARALAAPLFLDRVTPPLAL
ncbi:MAG: hypothetical protein WDM87_18220 [Terracidiphilus sp.]